MALAGLRRRLINFISSFLSDRTLLFLLGKHLSQFPDLKNGVLQGSVLSPISFNLVFNDNVKNVQLSIKCSLLVDNFAIFISFWNIKRSKNLTLWCNGHHKRNHLFKKQNNNYRVIGCNQDITITSGKSRIQSTEK